MKPSPTLAPQDTGLTAPTSRRTGSAVQGFLSAGWARKSVQRGAPGDGSRDPEPLFPSTSSHCSLHLQQEGRGSLLAEPRSGRFVLAFEDPPRVLLGSTATVRHPGSLRK